MVPYELEGKYYALPNTQSFPVMFYREDIFNDRGWKVPQTWDDLVKFIPNLQRENLDFYLPVNTTLGTSVVNPIFAALLYQKAEHFIATIIKNLTLIVKRLWTPLNFGLNSIHTLNSH